MPNQLSFLPKPQREHGGSHRRGRRKTQRPFDPKRTMHLTLRSTRGSRSLIQEKWRIQELLKYISKKNQIRVYRFANVGNHLHLLVQARKREQFQAFLREFAGTVAVMMTGAIKGSARKFWDGLAWSKIVDWGRQYKNTANYILLNVLEGMGRRSKLLLNRLQEDGIVYLEPDP